MILYRNKRNFCSNDGKTSANKIGKKSDFLAVDSCCNILINKIVNFSVSISIH